MIAMRLARTAAVLRLFAAPGDLLTRRQDRLPPIFALGTPQPLCGLLIDKEFAALDTAATQDLKNHLVELNVIDRTRQLVMAEMSRTLMIVEAA